MTAGSIVYLVHDDPQVQRRAAEIAESLGYDASVAERPEDFFEAYDDGRDSCLITDFRLRDYTTDAFLDAIENQSLSIPIIFVSAHASVGATVNVMKRGAVTVLELPFATPNSAMRLTKRFGAMRTNAAAIWNGTRSVRGSNR